MTNSIGIAFPIRYRCNYEGRKSAEISLYFSDKPITIEQVDLAQLGRNSEKAKKFYFKWNIYGAHDCLVPVKVRPLEGYQSKWGVKGGGFTPILKNNLITQAQFEYVELMPCTQEELPRILEEKAVLDFYFSIREGNFWLNIKHPSGIEGYVILPAQGYCPSCWHGYAHPVVTLESKAILPAARKLVSDIPWATLLDEMNGIVVKPPPAINTEPVDFPSILYGKNGEIMIMRY